MSFERIAVSTDFSDEARVAFPLAAGMAAAFGSELLLVHLAQVPPVLHASWPEVGSFFIPEDLFDKVGERLEEVAREDPAFSGRKVTPCLVRGDGLDALATRLSEEKVGLLVTATHGFSGFKKLLLGSFTDRLLGVAPCPVLVARSGFGGAIPPRRLFVPNDFTPASRPALGLARELARTLHARSTLHFVLEQSAGLYDYAAHMEGSFKEYCERVKAQALDRFRTLIREEWKGLEAEASTSVGNAAEEILKGARAQNADLIVLGTHSRSTIERFFVGSVTRKVVVGAHCPVLAVRA